MRTILGSISVARLAARLLAASPGRLIVLLSGAISVALATSGVLLAASTSVATVQDAVDYGWRGAYDLLVRPADAPSIRANGRDLVPLDYLGLRTSGITRAQWDQIAHMPGVDIAAPVAALGWMKNAAPGVGVELDNAVQGTAYVIDARATIAGRDALRERGLFMLNSETDDIDIGFHDVAFPPVQLGIGTLPSTWGLVVGVDPAAEDALVGLANHVSGTYLTTGTYQSYDALAQRSAIAVPIITASRAPLPGDLSVTVSTLQGVSPAQVAELGRTSLTMTEPERHAALSKLISLGSLVRLSGDDEPLADLLHPLLPSGILFGPDGRLVGTAEPRGGATGTNDDLVLLPSLTSYSVSSVGSADLTLASRGDWQNVLGPQLRALTPKGWSQPTATYGGDAAVLRDLKVTRPASFVLVPQGTYDREAMDRQFAQAANYAPLGIYASIPRTLITDSSGASANQPLPLSVNPAGLNPLPPLGLTNLEAVEALRGDRFIDAIRVRVAGVTGYSADSEHKIALLAERIAETTGLKVDVVAGSSVVDLKVAVPGVGVMSERWSTLGTAAQVVTGAQGISGVLLAGALVVVLTYLVASGVFLVGGQSQDLQTLERLGWRRAAILALVATQALALGAAAAAMSVMCILALAAAGGPPVDALAVALVAIAIVTAHPIAAGIVAAGRAWLEPTGGGKAGRLAPLGLRGGLMGVAALFAAETWGRSLAAVAAATIALSIAGVIAAAELAAGGQLRGTLFGAAIEVRLAPYHLLAASAALFGAGALILDNALLTVERRLPLVGTLRAVGWRSGAIRCLVGIETALPAIGAGVAAATVVTLVGVGEGLGPLAGTLGLGVLVLAVALGTAATWPSVGIAVNAPPSASLRADGASGSVRGYAPRQAIVTLLSIAVIVTAAAGSWGAAQRAASLPLPFVPPTEHPLSPGAIAIRNDVSAIVATGERTPGSAAFENAVEYLRSSLSAAGLSVETVSYLVPRPAFDVSSGDAIAPETVQAASIAYDVKAWDGRSADLPVTFADARGSGARERCRPGAIVLRVDDTSGGQEAQDLERECVGQTLLVLAARIRSDAGWQDMNRRVTRVHLPVGHFVLASTRATANGTSTPWIMAALDSSGPGATQSGAPTAVGLEVAVRAAKAGTAVRVAFAAASDGAAGSVVLQRIANGPAGPVLWLGPMGGRVRPVLGTASTTALDDRAATTSLTWVAPVDASFAGWLARVSQPSSQPTSDTLLSAISSRMGIVPTDELGMNSDALAAGMDAAWIAEPTTPSVGPRSVAGTASDTLDQVLPADLDQLASSLVNILGDIAHE